FIYFDCKLDHVPGNDFLKFGQNLGARIKAAGIPPERCVFSVGDPSAKALYQGVAAAGFGASARCMDGLHTSKPDEVPPDFWAKTAKECDLSMIGTGRSSLEVYALLADWWPPVRATVRARDLGADQ